MFYKAYTVLVPKAAVADPESLRKKAAELAKKCGMKSSEQWFGSRGSDWVFGFANNGNPAVLFRAYCAVKQIRCRAQWAEDTS
jgi:hypothetical protein